jgi:hypothetical protein
VTAAAEFNFYCDPEAAYITVHNMKCPITIFPYEAAYKYGRIPYVSILYGSHLGKKYCLTLGAVDCFLEKIDNRLRD